MALLAPTVDDGLVSLLWAKTEKHHTAIIAIGVFLALMILLARVLPDRRRLRFPLLMFGLYLVSIPVRTILDAAGYEASPVHLDIELAANICLAFGVIAVCGSTLFDVVGARITRVRILRDILSVIAGTITLVVMLSRAHVNLLSLVTTSAVLTAVVGLALQDTLGNIVSGAALQLESTISIGDWIVVGDATGQVHEIRWRSTSIVTRNDDLVVIPNALLAKGTFTNLSRPVPWHRQWVYFNVSYRHSPNEVQRTVVASLTGIKNVKPSDPAPDCILYRLNPDHMQFAVRYRLLDLRADDPTNSEVEKRIWFALGRKGIDFAFPTTNVLLTKLNPAREQRLRESEHKERKELLARVDLFSPLDAAHHELLAAELDVAIFGDGERILVQGDPGDSLFVIRRGTVSVRISVDGLEREIAKVHAGNFFGEMSLLTGETRHATVIAEGDVECYVVNHALFSKVVQGEALVSVLHDITTIVNNRARDLRGSLKDLGEDAARAHEQKHADLLDRVKRFFGAK